VNTYALFAELFASLTSRRGRVGVIVPTGIATDATTAPFFSALTEQRRLVCMISFENEEFIFPSVHHSFRFCLMTSGHTTQKVDLEFSFLIRRIEQINENERRFTLSVDDIARINPNTKTAPIFRSRADAEFTAKIYTRVPVLIDKTKHSGGNPWGVSFMAMFHMSNDSGHFRTEAQLIEAGFVRDGRNWVGTPHRADHPGLPGRDGHSPPLGGAPSPAQQVYAPLYEAKMIHQFDHRFGDARTLTERPVNAPWPHPSAEKLSDVSFYVEPWYWVPRAEVDNRLSNLSYDRSWFIAWRRNARSHDERTLISAIILVTGSETACSCF
jgi:hypothetical protein